MSLGSLSLNSYKTSHYTLGKTYGELKETCLKFYLGLRAIVMLIEILTDKKDLIIEFFSDGPTTLGNHI
jgi:hypothetical protein